MWSLYDGVHSYSYPRARVLSPSLMGLFSLGIISCLRIFSRIPWLLRNIARFTDSYAHPKKPRPFLGMARLAARCSEGRRDLFSILYWLVVMHETSSKLKIFKHFILIADFHTFLTESALQKVSACFHCTFSVPDFISSRELRRSRSRCQVGSVLCLGLALWTPTALSNSNKFRFQYLESNTH